MVAPARRKGWPPVSGSARRRLLLMALLAYATVAAGDDGSACDKAKCGKGNCTALPPAAIFPNFECDCDPGWSRAFNPVPFSPCIIPNCSFHGGTCSLNNSVTPPKPGPIPTLDICLVVNCGPGGTCRKVGDLSFSCDCRPGYSNLLNDTVFPCVKGNCLLGIDCSPPGPSPPPESPPPPSSAPAPTGDNNHDSSGSPAPPTGTKGSVSSRSLLQLLLVVVSVAMVQLV
ncbi:hypothetical protein ACP4OV_011069 [Aristida adscensionis]